MNIATQTTPARASDRPRYTIGSAAANSGVSARMIRHYESVGLMPRAGRSAGNYRTYSDTDVHTLRFIHRARELGFSMKQIVTLVSLWRNRSRPSATVRQLATGHIANLREKIDALQSMVNTLEDLARDCHGDARPECPILDDLAAPAVRGMRTGRSRS